MYKTSNMTLNKDINSILKIKPMMKKKGIEGKVKVGFLGFGVGLKGFREILREFEVILGIGW